jgi:hypothetical protein
MDIPDTLPAGQYAIYALSPPDKRGWNTLLQ